MYKKTYISVLLFLMAIVAVRAQTTFTQQPEKPKPGDVITFTYTPPAGFESAQTPLRCDAYKYGVYDEQMKYGAKPLKCQLVKLTKTGNSYTGQVQTDPETRFVGFAFTAGKVKFKSVNGKPVLVSGKVDTNKDNGYFTLLYDNSGKELNLSPLFAGLYLAGSFYNNLQFSNKKSSNQFLDRQIEMDSTIRFFCKSYQLMALQKDDADAARKMAQSEIEKIFKTGPVTEEDYLSASFFYYAGFTNVSQYFFKEGEAKFGKGNSFIGASVRKNEFWDTEDVEKKAVLAKEVTDFYNRANWNIRFFTLATSNTVPGSFYLTYLADLAKAGRVDEVIAALKAKNLFPYYYGGLVSWRRISSPLVEQKNPKVLELLADQEKFVKARWESLRKNPEQPAATPEEDCVTTTDRLTIVTTRYTYLQQQYAQYYANTGEFEKGFPYVKLAYSLSKENNSESSDINALYLQYAEKLSPKEVKSLAESFVKADAYTPEMKEKLKAIYTSEKKSDAGFDAYYAGLRAGENAKVDLKEVILSTKIDKPSPKFALQDLDGKTVSLESLKGKTVILDFWATWCGPCIASFPAMLKLKEAYANSGDVEVVFINTWEKNFKSSDELVQRIRNFTKEKKFDFNPLLDEKSVVVSDFGISGIPTKVVIDKNGRIRYKITGVQTDQDKLLEEMKIMIESVK